MHKSGAVAVCDVMKEVLRLNPASAAILNLFILHIQMYANEWRGSAGSLMTYVCNHRAKASAIVFLRKAAPEGCS